MQPRVSTASTRWSAAAPVLALAMLFFHAAPGAAQRAPALDVPFVPTPPEVVERMLDLAQVSEGDYVIDLGSGDGRIAIAAAKRGARALGIDLNPVRVEEARANARKEGVEDRVEFREQDLFETDFSEADVLTMYLLSSVNLKLRPRILEELKPGTRIVSHAFDMDEWKPDHAEKVDGRSVFYWVVPARIEGAWNVRNGGKSFTVTFDQEFQEISGKAEIDGVSVPLKDAELKGDRLTFVIKNGPGSAQKFVGRVTEDKIVPVQEQAGSADWQASRAS